MSGSEVLVKFRTDEGIAAIELDRPDRRNAINGLMVQQLRDAVVKTRADSRVILLRSTSEHFSGGLDLDVFGQDPAPDGVSRFPTDWAALHRELWDDGRPVVVEHRGAAVAGAAALLFSGDVVISGDTAWASVPELTKGMAAPVNMAWLLARHGVSVTTKMVLLGQRIDAVRLQQLGISTEVVANDDLSDRARQVAAQFASYVPAALNSTMRALRECGSLRFTQTLDEIRSFTGTLDPPRRP